jgi:hypothetical protein
MIIFFQILIGIGMVLFGRKLFWVFAAGVGFITAATWATRALSGRSDVIVLLIALAAGVIGGLIAIFIRWLGIGLAGFLGGAYIIYGLFVLFNLDLREYSWIVYLIGGGMGVIFFSVFFDWTLIIISSMSGALILTQSIARLFSIPRPLGIVMIVILIIIGIIIQARTLSIEHSG